MEEKSWKEYLLKSGLPFEYEVKECFAKNNCVVWDEYSYIKNDENGLEKEFSYDINVGKWDTDENNSFQFLVECKYKTKPTKWFFIPHPYSYQDELSQNSFLHSIDYFSDKKFIFQSYPYDSIQSPLGPFCLKGVEIFDKDYTDLNIIKAINQLSFAFVDEVINSIQNQIEFEQCNRTTFHNIPIIITNAELHLINENVTTEEIRNAVDIGSFSTKHDFLLFHNKIGESLRRHNLRKLSRYFASVGNEVIKNKNNSFKDDIEHLINLISEKYCPEVILIMHHDKEHKNYLKLFEYINFLVKPSVERKDAVMKVKREVEAQMKEFEERLIMQNNSR